MNIILLNFVRSLLCLFPFQIDEIPGLNSGGNSDLDGVISLEDIISFTEKLPDALQNVKSNATDILNNSVDSNLKIWIDEMSVNSEM